jgi:hypothetical protein
VGYVLIAIQTEKDPMIDLFKKLISFCV